MTCSVALLDRGHFMPHDNDRASDTMARVMRNPFQRIAGGRLAILVSLGMVVTCWSEPTGWQMGRAPLMTRWAAQVNPTNALPEYPRPQLVRRDWLNLNGLWDYAIAAAAAGAPTQYEGKILVPFPVESALSGVMRRLEEKDCLWYRREVAVPSSWRGQRVRLHFGAVDWEARVRINGHEIGQHRGGYDRFGFDVTDHLRWDGREEIVVAVTDPTEGDQPRGKQSRKPEGIFYTPNSGIWQTVWLEPVPTGCIDDLKLTPDVDAKSLRLRVAVNSLSDALRVEAVARAAGKEVGRISGTANTELLLPVADARLWTPEDPFLYDLQVTLKKGGQALDSVTSYFGMRKVALRKDAQGITRITLNDQFIFQAGTLDQGFWPDGIYTAPTDEALRSDIEFLKSARFNLTRKHVKVEPDRWYYWCDKLGLLVWQDMPSGNNATPAGRRGFENELQHMVADLENHPSLIVWVLFNEGWGQYETERLTPWLKSLDPSRLVDNASGWTDMRVGDLIDAHTYPGPDSPEPESRRAAVLGEFGGLGLPLDGHAWSERCWGYLMLGNVEELTSRYTALFNLVWTLHDLRGLSAAIYTQTTDVETECNGLLTYDRAVAKIPTDKLRAANLGKLRGPAMRFVLPDAMFGRTLWKYTLEKPPDDWTQPEFDASAWKEGAAGFAGAGTPGIRMNSAWKTSDIWLRVGFVLTAAECAGLKLRVFHDEDAEVYVNGVLAVKLAGFGTDYVELTPTPEAVAALRPGHNTVAVHCHQTSGGQGIDVGVLVPKETTP
jgi:hypothetical protein